MTLHIFAPDGLVDRPLVLSHAMQALVHRSFNIPTFKHVDTPIPGSIPTAQIAFEVTRCLM